MLGTETIAIAEACGRVLAQDMKALHRQPPFAAAAMDGYALRAGDGAAGRVLRIIGRSAAGHPFSGTVTAGETVRIFTGAPLPDGADTVLIQENADILADDRICVREPVAAHKNTRKAGLDFDAGDILLKAGRVLDPAALSLCAAAGHGNVAVARRPRVAIVATGDELVEPGTEPGPGQIAASSGVAISAMATGAGARTRDLGIAPDNRDLLAACLRQAVDWKADILVTLGGASVGDHDLVQDVFRDAGMELGFWKIAMRPGKPLIFGRLGAMRILGLPGNPVSGFVCATLFLVPLIRALQGAPWQADMRTAFLSKAMPENDSREDYVRAHWVCNADGTLTVEPFGVQDSSMLSALAAANGLIVRPPHAPAAPAGSPVDVLILRQ
jgi:molybdopterin molybdotransferase